MIRLLLQVHQSCAIPISYISVVAAMELGWNVERTNSNVEVSKKYYEVFFVDFIYLLLENFVEFFTQLCHPLQ